MNSIIREAREKDVDIIADYQLKMALETENLHLDPQTVLAGVKAVLNDSAKGFYLLTEEDEKVIASLLITTEWSDWRAKTVWWIQSLYVLPGYRQKGIFKSMYLYLKDKTNLLPDIAGIRLYVDKTNTLAQSVYKNIGMNGDHYILYEDMF